MTLEERTLTLSMIPEFRELRGPERRHLASAMREEAYSTGEVVCREGEPADRVFVVHNGMLVVTQSGRDGAVRHLTRGALVGELAFFDGNVRTATVSAATESELLSLDYERLRKFLLAHPDAALVMAARIARMLRSAEEALAVNDGARRGP
jgi:CRP/FNR family cyclic AMP-dependent transcriptional regulator